MRVRCAGCGWEAPPARLPPFACPRRDALRAVDHVLTRELDGERPPVDHASENPFVRYRRWLAAYGWAGSDQRFVDVAGELDDRVAAVDGRHFRRTPCRFAPPLGAWVKDETVGVSGSHKGRHVMGLMIGYRLAGLVPERPLAIASCGNAALAAAVVARAAGWVLDVFVPPWADPAVTNRLSELGARLVVCPRQDGDPAGDPCHHRFREAVAAGALPFGCQGPDNGLTIDGGRTLGYEMAEQVPALGRLFVQVGGGALAASVGGGLREWLGPDAPAVVAVQAAGCAPLARAWHRLDGHPVGEARAERGHYMWPWEEEPHSVATGILDDETYDWAAVLEVVQATGGDVIVVDDAELEEARRSGHDATGIDVDATGAAGWAGLHHAGPPTDRPHRADAVIFTGAVRR